MGKLTGSGRRATAAAPPKGPAGSEDAGVASGSTFHRRGAGEFESLLQRIVQSACQLVDARYGAWGVIAEGGGGLSHFVTEGIA